VRRRKAQDLAIALLTPAQPTPPNASANPAHIERERSQSGWCPPEPALHGRSPRWERAGPQCRQHPTRSVRAIRRRQLRCTFLPNWSPPQRRHHLEVGDHHPKLGRPARVVLHAQTVIPLAHGNLGRITSHRPTWSAHRKPLGVECDSGALGRCLQFVAQHRNRGCGRRNEPHRGGGGYVMTPTGGQGGRAGGPGTGGNATGGNAGGGAGNTATGGAGGKPVTGGGGASTGGIGAVGGIPPKGGSQATGGAGTGGMPGTGGSTLLDAGTDSPPPIACTLDGGQCPNGFRCACGGHGPVGVCSCHKECTAITECGAGETCGCTASDPAPRICVNACFCTCG